MKNPYNKINKDMECLKNENCIPIIIEPTGPRGRDGKDGVADTIKIENTHILDFANSLVVLTIDYLGRPDL